MLVHILANTPFAGPGIVDGRLIDGYVDGVNPLVGKGGTGYSVLSSLLWRPYLTTYQTDLNLNLKLKHKLDYITQGLSISGTFSYNDLYRKGVKENALSLRIA